MRTALTVLEVTIGSVVLIGCLAITMDGMAMAIRLAL
jgi:hypothetical protein